MSSLVNESVKHSKFGKGIIVSEGFYSVDIVFENNPDKRSFVYPDSFEKFLQLENDGLQKECIDLVIRNKAAIEKEAQDRQIEQERLNEEQKIQMSLSAKVKRSSKKISNTPKKSQTVSE